MRDKNTRPAGARFWLALWAAKLTVPALKLTRHTATNLPGKVAMRLCPDFLNRMDKPELVIAVTGTNGKTTVSNLLFDALAASGRHPRGNRSGANMYSGVISALLGGVDLRNRRRYDTAVLETDEHATRLILPETRPRLCVVTNLFRDSIMRNAHPEFVAGRMTKYIPAGTRLVLNADDPISSGVAPDNPRVYFGLEPGDYGAELPSRLNDLRICPRCGGRIVYDSRVYHHIGRVHCTDCGFHSPTPDYLGTDVDLAAGTMRITDAGGSGEYRLVSDTVFNAYNILAVVAALRELGMSHEEIRSCLSGALLTRSRHTEETIGGVRLINQLSKSLNPSACSRNFQRVASEPGKKEVLMLLDTLDTEHGYSENICWMYDCDYEYLADPSIHLVVTGPRGKDTVLRLKLAGVEDAQLDYARDPYEAAELLRLEPGTSVFVLYGGDDAKTLDLAIVEKLTETLRKREGRA